MTFQFGNEQALRKCLGEPIALALASLVGIARISFPQFPGNNERILALFQVFCNKVPLGDCYASHLDQLPAHKHRCFRSPWTMLEKSVYVHECFMRVLSGTVIVGGLVRPEERQGRISVRGCLSTDMKEQFSHKLVPD